jgi:glutamate 5-kinase
MATAVGENVIIANGARPGVLDDILAGRDVGTLFLARGASLPAWKRWIGYTVRPKGKFVLDDGARTAIETSGRSLLAIGIAAVEGEFEKGEVVSLVDKAGVEFARGLTNYPASDARKIAGKKTDGIITALGSLPYGEVIHRDNLVVRT